MLGSEAPSQGVEQRGGDGGPRCGGANGRLHPRLMGNTPDTATQKGSKETIFHPLLGDTLTLLKSLYVILRLKHDGNYFLNTKMYFSSFAPQGPPHRGRNTT